MEVDPKAAQKGASAMLIQFIIHALQWTATAGRLSASQDPSAAHNIAILKALPSSEMKQLP